MPVISGDHRQAWAKSKILLSKITTAKRAAGGVAPVIECLSHKYNDVLHSNLSTTKKNYFNLSNDFCSHKALHVNVHSSFIHNCECLDVTEVFFKVNGSTSHGTPITHYALLQRHLIDVTTLGPCNNPVRGTQGYLLLAFTDKETEG
jgi:hypothetical protein